MELEKIGGGVGGDALVRSFNPNTSNAGVATRQEGVYNHAVPHFIEVEGRYEYTRVDSSGPGVRVTMILGDGSERSYGVGTDTDGDTYTNTYTQDQIMSGAGAVRDYYEEGVTGYEVSHSDGDSDGVLEYIGIRVGFATF
jgi:hypothetical protein